MQLVEKYFCCIGHPIKNDANLTLLSKMSPGNTVFFPINRSITIL